MCVNALSRVNDEATPQSALHGARVVLEDYSDKTRRYDLGNRAWYPHVFVSFFLCER